MYDRLPRFDETGALPAFSFEDLNSEDLELIEEAPRSLMPVAVEEVIEEISIVEILDEGEAVRPARWGRIGIGAALVAAGFVALFAHRTEHRAFLAQRVESTREPFAVEAPPVVTAPSIVAPPPVIVAPAKTTGTLVTPLWARGRRVWIDGKVVQGHAPRVEAACGKHVVKIGAFSKSKKVDIPCGGEVKITP